MPRINVTPRKDLEAALRDPILTDPVSLASFRQLDIDPSLYAQNIVLDADVTRQIESSGGLNLSNLLTTARGDYQITKDTLPTLLQSYLNTASEEGIELPAWILEAADAYTEKAVTKENLPRLLQSFMNQKFADGQEIPQWALNAANAKEVTGRERESWNERGISHFVGSNISKPEDLTKSQLEALTPERDKLMRGENYTTDPMDLEPWQQRVLYANGKNRSINENGDQQVYRDGIQQGDTNVFTDMYMDHWHRGNRFSEAELNAMSDGGARVRAEIDAARNRANDLYSLNAPQFVIPEEPPRPIESEPNLLSGLLSSQDQAMQPTPYDPIEPQPSLAGADFGIEDRLERKRQGMMAGLGVDVPQRDRAVVPQPSLRGTNFGLEDGRERRRQSMLSSLGVDVPQRDRVVVPQPRLDGANFGIEDRLERKRQGMMAGLGVDIPATDTAPVSIGREPAASQLARQTQDRYAVPDTSFTPPPPVQLEEIIPTQRGQVPIPQKRQPPPAPTAPLRPESQPNIEAMLASQQDQAMNPVVRPPEPVPEPVLEEIVPTQRGQVPIPQRPPVEPERVVGSEPRLESELASQMATVVPAQPTPEVGAEPNLESDLASSVWASPASPQTVLSSPEEVTMGIGVVTPVVRRESIESFPPPKYTVDSESLIPPEAMSTEKLLPTQFEKPATQPPAMIQEARREDAAEEARRIIEANAPAPALVMTDEQRLNAESEARKYMPEERESGAQFLLRNSARNVANALTLNAYDYAESGLRSVMGEEYDDVFKEIRQERSLLNRAYPKTQLAGELGGAGLSGGVIAGLAKRSGKIGGVQIANERGAYGAEGLIYGTLSGNNAEERIAGGVVGGLFGLSAGQVVHWATGAGRNGKAGATGARTDADDVADDDILIQNINQAQKTGESVLYRTNKGELKRVTIVRGVKKNNKKAPDKRYQSQEREVLVKDERGNQFVVPSAKIERVKLTGVDSTKFEQTMKFENSNYQYKPARQVIKEKYNEDGSIALTKEGEEAVANGDPLNSSMIQMELRDATWRDARNAGELWDSLVLGGRKLYDDFVRGSEDTLYQRVSKQVGGYYQIASTNAGRVTTKDFVEIGQPLTPLSKAIDSDKYLKGLIGDVTNRYNLLTYKYTKGTESWNRINKEATMENLQAYIKTKYGDDALVAWDNYVEWNRKKKVAHVDILSGMKQFTEGKASKDVHIHMHLTKEAKEARIKRSEAKRQGKVDYDPLSRADSALEKRSRNSFILGDTNVDDYMNPLFTDFRRTANLEQLYQLGKKFGLKMPEIDSGEDAYKVFQRLEQSFIDRGINPEAAKFAAKTMSDDFVGSTRSPNGWLQALNSVGYLGSLAGFKSAVLNLHDIPMAAVLYGPSSFRGIANVKGVNITDQGIRQNVGEFRDLMIDGMRSGDFTPAQLAAYVTRKGTDIAMNASGFSWFDTVGKNSISKMIIQSTVDEVDNLKARWGFYFDEKQLGILQSQIKKHGTDLTKYSKEGSDLMEELFFAGLGQQQLISGSGRPAAWARHPNFRMMWALRGFAIKQLALVEKNIVDNILEGNTKAAVDYMKRYVIFAAGSFGLLNESRQWMFGDGNFTAGGVLMGMGDQIISTASLNTIGINDYQWGRMMRNGIFLTWLESLIPIGIDIPKDMVFDIKDAIDGDVKGNEDMTPGQRAMYPLAQLPIVKQTGRFFDNFSDTNIAGVPIRAPLPSPIEDINRKYLLSETGARE